MTAIRLMRNKQTTVLPKSERTPRCEHFFECGGCTLQHLDYATQLTFKNEQLKQSFKGLKAVANAVWLPVLGCADQWRYRNKTTYDFKAWQWIPKRWIEQGIRVDDQRSIGFYPPGIFDKVVNIESCLINSTSIDEIRNALRSYAREKQLDFEDTRANTGFLRSVMFRESFDSGKIMLLLCVRKNKKDVVEPLFKFLKKSFPYIESFYWTVIDDKKVDFSRADLKLWGGAETLTEKLGDYQFSVSPKAFFQTNTHQAEQLYRTIEGFLRDALPVGQTRYQCLYDLYCGTGSIGIFVEKLAETVVGIETIEAAIDDARTNVELNKLEHFKFFSGDISKVLDADFQTVVGSPDAIVIDPPRAGIQEDVAKKLVELNPRVLVYVSCNPDTQARDLRALQHRYAVEKIQPVDMFPQTEHLETVLLLIRK